MLQPRYSARKVPGHRVIGAKVSSAIESFLRYHPYMMDKLLNSIGAEKDAVNKPTPDEIDLCTQYVRKILPFNSKPAFLTQLNEPLITAWVRAAEDPDKPLTRWLREGTPAGITQHAEQTGISPPASKTDEMQEKVLQELHAGFKNYGE